MNKKEVTFILGCEMGDKLNNSEVACLSHVDLGLKRAAVVLIILVFSFFCFFCCFFFKYIDLVFK